VGLGKGSAVDVAFPQAVPSAFAVNAGKCLFLTRGKCGDGPKCVAACEVGAIHLDEAEREEILAVDAVVVAVGYDPYRPDAVGIGRPELGFGRYPEVITNLQFERLSSASGPTGGKIRVGDAEPKHIVFLQCVGSRDRTTGASYCSRVCCMVSVKQAVLALEKIPGCRATILYMDLRAFGKGYEEFVERAQRMGAVLRRGNPSEVYRKGECLAVRFEDTLLGRAEELRADLVVLAAGLRPRSDFEELSRVLGVALDADGFFASTDPRDPTLTRGPGIFLAGTCMGPMDIPDAVASGSAAAGAALAFMAVSGFRVPGSEPETAAEAESPSHCGVGLP
jgi:heterodisulfide reductase subunit A